MSCEIGDYVVFLKVSDEFDENYGEEERQKLINFYKERISLHEKSKFLDELQNKKDGVCAKMNI